MPNGDPKIKAKPIVGKDGKPLNNPNAKQRYKTLLNVFGIMRFKAEGDRLDAAKEGTTKEEADRLKKLAKKLEKVANDLEKLLKKGGILLVDNLPKTSPANTSTNPKDPKEKRLLIRTEMVDFANRICNPIFTYLLEILFHEGIHVGQEEPQRPVEPEGLDEDGKKRWRRQHLLPYKMKMAAGEYEAYVWNNLFLGQIPEVLDKIKENMEKPAPQPPRLDGLSDGQKRWARLWSKCSLNEITNTQKVVKEHIANKKLAFEDIGKITPDGNPRPPSEYDQLEKDLGANEGLLEKLLDNGYHFTWFAEYEVVDDKDNEDELFIIGYSSASNLSGDGIDLSMGGPQAIQYIRNSDGPPYLVICGTTEPYGNGEPKILIRPANEEAYDQELDRWVVSSLSQFSIERQIELAIPESLLRPADILTEPSGRLLVWDSVGIGLYALTNFNEAGLPQAISTNSQLNLSEEDREALMDRPVLMAYGEQPAAFTRPTTKDRATSTVAFLFDSDATGIYNHVTVREPTDLPWVQPMINGPVFSGESWVSVSGAGGHTFKLQNLADQRDGDVTLAAQFLEGRDPTALQFPQPFRAGEYIQLSDLDNEREAVAVPVIGRTIQQIALELNFGRSTMKEMLTDMVIAVVDRQHLNIYIRDSYGDRVREALDADDEWRISDLEWETQFEAVDFDQLDQKTPIESWHAFVLRDHIAALAPRRTGLEIRDNESKTDFFRLTEDHEICFPFDGEDCVTRFINVELKQYPESEWQGLPTHVERTLSVALWDLPSLDRLTKAPENTNTKKDNSRRNLIIGFFLGILTILAILASIEYAGFFCSGPCAVTRCSVASPCTWKGKTYTSGITCGFGEGLVCDVGYVYDCHCKTVIERLPSGVTQPACLCQ